MDIDSVIAEGVAASAAEAQPKVDAKIEATSETVTEEASEPDEPVAEPKDDPFPKKAVNAISRRDKQIGKLRAQYEQAQAELTRLRTQAPQPQAKKPENSGEPKEADFDNYADYMRAVQRHDLQQALAERDGKQQQTHQEAQQRAYYEDLYVKTQARSDEFIAQTPDAQAVFEEYADVIEACPENIYKIFLESGDAPLAAYNLAKQGKLEDIMSMSPARAAIEIGRALAQANKPKPTTKAPTPLAPAKGTATSNKTIDGMKADELMKWVAS